MASQQAEQRYRREARDDFVVPPLLNVLLDHVGDKMLPRPRLCAVHVRVHSEPPAVASLTSHGPASSIRTHVLLSTDNHLDKGAHEARRKNQAYQIPSAAL
eukprot:2985954-Rhodomonas_salina.1